MYILIVVFFYVSVDCVYIGYRYFIHICILYIILHSGLLETSFSKIDIKVDLKYIYLNEMSLKSLNLSIVSSLALDVSVLLHCFAMS